VFDGGNVEFAKHRMVVIGIDKDKEYFEDVHAGECCEAIVNVAGVQAMVTKT
jgi:hypothetical protein